MKQTKKQHLVPLCFSILTYYILSFACFTDGHADPQIDDIIEETRYLPLDNIGFEIDAFRFGGSDHLASERNQVIPLLVFNLDFIDRVINLTPNRSRDGIITTNDQSHGFLVEKWRSIHWGVGFASKWFKRISSKKLFEDFGHSLGIAPIIGSKSLFRYYAKDSEEVEEKRKIPKDKKGFDQWRVGDSVRFARSGGVLIKAEIGPQLISFGPEVAVIDEFQILVQKIDREKIYVKIVNTMAKNIALFFDGIKVVKVSTSRLLNKGKVFAYEIDLSTADGMENYLRIFSGDLTEVENSSSVKRKYRGGVNSYSRFSKLSFGVPFFRLQFKSGKIHHFSKKYHFAENLLVEEAQSLYIKESHGQLLKRRSNKAKIFSANLVKVINDDSVEEEQPLREESTILFRWFQEKNKASTKSITEMLKKFHRSTLLGNIPQIMLKQKEKLKYLKIDYQFKLSDQSVKNLLRLGNYNGFKKYLLQNQYEKIEILYSQREILFLCPARIKITRLCRKYLRSRAIENSKKIAEMLMAVKNNFSNLSEAGKRIGHLGKEIWQEPVLFYAWIKIFQACPSESKFEISGEQISRFRSEVKVNNFTSECFLSNAR